MSKVVHLSEPIHALAKQYCQERRLRMNEWVGHLIADSCRAAGYAAAQGNVPVKVQKGRLQAGPGGVDEAVETEATSAPQASGPWLSESPA